MTLHADQDIQEYDQAKARLAQGEEELIPAEVVNAFLDGENAFKVWREFRGLSQTELAEKAGISTPYLSQLETEKRQGSIEVVSTLAKILGISLDMLYPS